MTYLSTTPHKITTKGRTQVEKFRGRLSRWFDTAIDIPYSTKEGLILQHFAEHPEGVSPSNIYYNFNLLPMQVDDTITLLRKKGYIEIAER